LPWLLGHEGTNRDFTSHQGDQKFGKKFTQILENVPKAVGYPKDAKISTLMLHLKVQNIYGQPILNL
jgi:hypothetical protein